MDPVKLMSFYTAYLRALYLVHQNNHWKCKGPNFYGNHLLLQRIYEATGETVDEAAEKAVGLYGDLIDMPEVIKSVVEKYSPDNFNGDCVAASLAAEEQFQDISQKTYDELKGGLTLGLDDFLMGMASKHELHIYLLKQSGKHAVAAATEMYEPAGAPEPLDQPAEEKARHSFESSEVEDKINDGLVHLYAIKDLIEQGAEQQAIVSELTQALTVLHAAEDQARTISMELLKAIASS